MKVGIILSLVLLLLAASVMSFETPKASAVVDMYELQLRELDHSLVAFKHDLAGENETQWKADFLECRLHFKMIEPVVGYFYPYTEIRMNGPAVFEVEPSDFSEINYPTGFQVLEEKLFSDDKTIDKTGAMLKQLNYLLSYVHLLQHESEHLNITPSIVFDISRTGLYDMVAKGLSGFDSPVAYYGVKEAGFTMMAIDSFMIKNGTCTDSLQRNIDDCLRSLNQKPFEFEQYDKAAFISKEFNHLMKSLYQCQMQYKVPFVKQRAAVKTNAESFLAANAFDPYFFALDSTLEHNEAQIALGKRLFNETALSFGGRSCASCHRPEKAYTDGLPKNTSLQRDEMILRNTPTILNAALQPFLFYDARSSSLEKQAHEVLANKDEMNGCVEKAMTLFRSDDAYLQQFNAAFPKDKDPVSQQNMVAAITAFERSLVKMNAPFDKFMRGDSKAMNSLEQKGFNLFMGKAKCGTCHYMPLFNGVVPPFYRKEDTEIIGVTSKADDTHPALDADPGAYNYFHNDIKRHAFKTPTLRNIALTAPYMHNGAFATLDQVIDFYNKGGAVGMGLKLDNQTLSPDRLQLDTNEKKALIAFLKTLTDNQTN